MNQVKKTILLFFLSAAITGCTKPSERAERLGFNSVDEMEKLQKQGFHSKKNYYLSLLPNSGCQDIESLKHALSEVGGDCNKLKKIRLAEQEELERREKAALEEKARQEKLAQWINRSDWNYLIGKCTLNPADNRHKSCSTEYLTTLPEFVSTYYKFYTNKMEVGLVPGQKCFDDPALGLYQCMTYYGTLGASSPVTYSKSLTTPGEIVMSVATESGCIFQEVFRMHDDYLTRKITQIRGTCGEVQLASLKESIEQGEKTTFLLDMQ